MGNNIQYEDLIRHVIKVAQEEIPLDEQKRIKSTRLNKMTILVFNELTKNDINTDRFVWGYYRHGFYSRSVSNFLEYNYKDGFSLEEAEVADVNFSDDIKNLIEKTIINIKDNFLKDRESFTKWVYGEITPKKYREFYFSHKKLEKWFENMSELNNEQMKIDYSDKYNLPSLVSEYYFSLKHIDDLEVIAIFRRFTDILELLNLKISGGTNHSKIKVLIDRLNNLYLNRIYSLLPPYAETINGDLKFAKKEKEMHLLRINSYKDSINNELDDIYLVMQKNDLLPSLEEINVELLKMQQKLPSDVRSLKQLYEDQ